MKRYLILLLLLVLVSGEVSAFGNKNRRGLPRTEAGLMNNLVGCLRYRDTAAYFNLFVPFDTLWQLALHNPDRSPEAQQELNHLKEHPQALVEFDPKFNPNIMGRFISILKKGEDSGLHWDGITMQRYELQRQGITSSKMLGYDKIAPERFKGYLFVKDLLGRTTWCITVAEIQKIDGYFFGGQVINMLQASTTDEYIRKEADEARYMQWLAAHPFADSAMIDSMKNGGVRKKDSSKYVLGADDEEANQSRRQVIDRKYYEGMFDETIPVKLYVRYMKEVVGNKPTQFDGLYKFGDQQSYVRLEITCDATGKWIMEDDVPLGGMELVLRDKVYRGTWTNANDNGYEVKLTESGVPPRKLEAMDNILDKGESGRIDEVSFFDDPADARAYEEEEKARERKRKEAEEDDEKEDSKKGKKSREEKDKAKSRDNKFIDAAQKKADKEEKKAERREKQRLRRLKEENE